MEKKFKKSHNNLTVYQFSSFTQIGFTLIEILVSLTVILIIVGITIAGYSRLNQRQNLIGAGQTMKNILRDAQSRAYNGEIDCIICDCSVGSGENLTGWNVDFISKEIYGQCDGNTFPSPRNPFNLSNEIIIETFNNPVSTLLFRSYPLGVDESTTICLSDNNLDDMYYKITVENSGYISDEGSLDLSCP